MSNIIIPLIVLIIIIYGVKQKRDIYYDFIEGSKESFSMIKNLFPTFLGMFLGINLLINSGFLSFIFKFLEPILNIIKVPIEILPLAFIRPISGSAALAILNNIFTKYGPDSFIGIMSSIMQGSTDTTFYIITLYFGSVGIKKIKYALWVGLFADLVGFITSIVFANILF